MEETIFLVSILFLIGANILATLLLVRIRREFIETFSHTTRSLVAEWNKVIKTVTILTSGMDLEKEPLTGDLTTSKSEDFGEKPANAMSESKQALYKKAGGNQS